MIINWKTDDFDPRAASLLGEAASLVYNDYEIIKQVVEQDWKMELLEFYDVQDTQAFLARTPKVDGGMILAFRGTSSLKDWMTDADIRLINGPGGKVHEGFNCALNTIWRNLWKRLSDSTQRGQRSLWITGHSLGASLATLATAKIRLEQSHPVSGLYTFGSPRTGDHDFKRNFEQDFLYRTYRFVNNKDVVPRIPFRVLNYDHVGTFKYFTQNGKVDDKKTWDQILLDGLKGTIDELLNPATEGVRDHAIMRYVENLSNLLPREAGIRGK